MKNLFLLCLLLTACFKPVTVEVGMTYDDFKELCKLTNEDLSRSSSMSNTQGTFFTIEIEDTKERREKGIEMKGCFGKFTFLNNKLDTIH